MLSPCTPLPPQLVIVRPNWRAPTQSVRIAPTCCRPVVLYKEANNSTDLVQNPSFSFVVFPTITSPLSRRLIIAQYIHDRVAFITMSFLKLPAEIRLRIYERLLKAKRFIIFPQPPDYKARLHPAILRTCKTIHREAAPVLYGKNRFMIESVVSSWMINTKSRRMFQKIGLNNARCIQHLVIAEMRLSRLLNSQEQQKLSDGLRRIWTHYPNLQRLELSSIPWNFCWNYSVYRLPHPDQAREVRQQLCNLAQSVYGSAVVVTEGKV